MMSEEVPYNNSPFMTPVDTPINTRITRHNWNINNAPGSDSDNDTDNGIDINPNKPIGDVDLEIVGLFGSTNGKSCSVHNECGAHVKVGDLLRLKPTVVTVNGKEEAAIKLNKINEEGVEGCTVAFLPRIVLNTPIVLRNIDCFCVVKELYSNSISDFKRSKSHRAMGMAGVVVLNEIPHSE
jgi:hypothetical protein